MNFLNEVHEDRYLDLVSMANVTSGDTEREALFYIISGVPDLFREVNCIYDFEENMLLKYNLEYLGLSSSCDKLLNLAVQLFNGNNQQSILGTFGVLDDNNFNLALNAIKIRFNKG